MENALLSKLQEAQAQVEQTEAALVASEDRVAALEEDRAQQGAAVSALTKQLGDANRWVGGWVGGGLGDSCVAFVMGVSWDLEENCPRALAGAIYVGLVIFCRGHCCISLVRSYDSTPMVAGLIGRVLYYYCFI